MRTRLLHQIHCTKCPFLCACVAQLSVKWLTSFPTVFCIMSSYCMCSSPQVRSCRVRWHDGQESLSLLVRHLGGSRLSLNRLPWLLMTVCRGWLALSIIPSSLSRVLLSATIIRESSFMPTTEVGTRWLVCVVQSSLLSIHSPIWPSWYSGTSHFNDHCKIRYMV